MKEIIKNTEIFDKAVLGIMSCYPQTTMYAAENSVNRMDMQEVSEWAKFYDDYMDATYAELEMALAECY
ncbi:MAG: hypothetical protein HFK10_09025 [Clostridia bacterium]|jgi:hypothetical protein|nr:hypothetical protein [Clostridia bacterium]